MSRTNKIFKNFYRSDQWSDQDQPRYIGASNKTLNCCEIDHFLTIYFSLSKINLAFCIIIEFKFSKKKTAKLIQLAVF